MAGENDDRQHQMLTCKVAFGNQEEETNEGRAKD